MSTSRDKAAPASALRLRRLGIDTYQEAVLYVREDCPVCRSEGFNAQSRVRVDLNGHSAIATLDVVKSDILRPGEASLSEAAWRSMGASEGDLVKLSHPTPVESLGLVRSKLYGRRLDGTAMRAIVTDIVAGRYSDVQVSAFVAACSGDNMDRDEMIALTRAMLETGQRIEWPTKPILDKHSIGGLPGNRTTPIVVAIAAAAGLTIPKTSSRAITSPAGTADTMDTLTCVDIDLATMRRVVEKEGGCFVWGGAVRLSPADDILIRIERALDIDSQGQLVASVLSKKAAAGSTHVVIDIPVGPTAKIRTPEAAEQLRVDLVAVAGCVGLTVVPILTDGTQPVGRGIGPGLEARDVLEVLERTPGAPADLRARSLLLAGAVLELAGLSLAGAGLAAAQTLLDSGAALEKFTAICEAQGGRERPPRARHTHEIVAAHAGRITRFDNRLLARVAKLAGAPKAPAAGLDLHVRLDQRVDCGEPLYTVHAETPGELAYALEFAAGKAGVVTIGETT
jgi:thymidine phosphorylase